MVIRLKKHKAFLKVIENTGGPSRFLKKHTQFSQSFVSRWKNRTPPFVIDDENGNRVNAIIGWNGDEAEDMPENRTEKYLEYERYMSKIFSHASRLKTKISDCAEYQFVKHDVYQETSMVIHDLIRDALALEDKMAERELKGD